MFISNLTKNSKLIDSKPRILYVRWEFVFQGPLWQHLDSLVDSGGSSCRLWRPFTRNASIFTDFMIGNAN
ncbi:hypothetical protein T02_9400 [Trichinella nativa]|uniref:Uncharacterized protein n=1 Tax=Trichinella nativa TaxID=6335 RepID=A0A0V1KQ82_9BILA|nr:hypothetical protein T02_9400 [Trichinella nativa]